MVYRGRVVGAACLLVGGINRSQNGQSVGENQQGNSAEKVNYQTFLFSGHWIVRFFMTHPQLSNYWSATLQTRQ